MSLFVFFQIEWVSVKEGITQSLVETLYSANSEFYSGIYVAINTLTSILCPRVLQGKSFSSMKRFKTPPFKDLMYTNLTFRVYVKRGTHPEPTGTCRNHPEPPGTTRNHPEPTRNPPEPSQKTKIIKITLK